VPVVTCLNSQSYHPGWPRMLLTRSHYQPAAGAQLTSGWSPCARPSGGARAVEAKALHVLTTVPQRRT